MRSRDRERYAAWRASDPKGTSVAIRAAAQLRRYGMAPEDYQRLLDAQRGECGLPGCHRTHADPPRGRLNVDHSHTTGAIRGLLCWHHNLMLGLADDDPTVLLNAVNYLASPPAMEVLDGLRAPGYDDDAKDEDLDRIIHQRVRVLAASRSGQ